jgi:hypothetical protein
VAEEVVIRVIIEHAPADEVVDATIRCDGEIGVGCVNGPADHEFNATCRPLEERLPAPELSPDWQMNAARAACKTAVDAVLPRISAGQREKISEDIATRLMTMVIRHPEMQVRPPGQE